MNAQDCGGGTLFIVSQGAQLLAGNILVVVVAAFVSACQEGVADFVPRFSPAGQGCAAEKLWVIGVREDDQNALFFRPFC